MPEGLELPKSDPRQVVSKSLTYLENNRTRMNYPEYRRQGLPTMSGLVLLCQLGRYPLWHAHEFTQQQLLGRFEPEPVADLAMYLRQ